MCIASRVPLLIIATALTLIATKPAGALTQDQALENCKNSVGRAIVQACMKSGGDFASCRSKSVPNVKSCVASALKAAHGRANVAVPLPKEQGPSADIAKRAAALPTNFVAPPRTINDITAILDSEKPDPEKLRKLRAEADAPVTGRGAELARSYYHRATARAASGRLKESIADTQKAVETARTAGDAHLLGRTEQFLGLQYVISGDLKRALAVYQQQIRSTGPGAKAFLFFAYRQIASIMIQLGDIAQAEGYLRRGTALMQEARTSGFPQWRNAYALAGHSWEAEIELGRALIMEARGRYSEAESAYHVAEVRRRAGIPGILKTPNPPPLMQLGQTVDLMVVAQARMKARQGRLAEAEAEARRALLSRLKDQGKYNPTTPIFIMTLANVLVEQGRYGDAEKLIRIAIEVAETVGTPAEAQTAVQMMSHLASVLTLQYKESEAAEVYAQVDKAMANWDPALRQALDLNGARILSLYASGQTARGVAAAETLVKKNAARLGEKAYETAAARGILAIGYMKAGRDNDAIREFRAAIPLLTTGARENADDEVTTGVAARSERLRKINESYIALLDRMPSANDDDVAAETFTLADSMRGQSVQQALAASSARMLAKDQALAELVREEQDLTKQVNAQLGILNNTLELPSGERDDNAVKALNASIAQLRNDRDRKRADIAKRFPSYADLIDPDPPSVKDVQSAMKPGEAMLSFYFGRTESFVWAIPKSGKAMLAAIPVTADQIEAKVRKLREALEPQAEMISDIPDFDLNLAHELYGLLLKPVEAGWKPAKKLIVVTNGALGLLPLSLLPTAPATAADGEGPRFSGYRNVPWLARAHAVAVVPSAAAFKTLRQIPAGSDKRERFIGFGDPIFGKDQDVKVASNEPQDSVPAEATTMRGAPLKRRSSPKLDGVDSAELSLLPALPDTADELKSIALALEADPSKVLRLGKQANEQTVKNEDLSRFRTIVFATHGLVPGELNGLTQPALALSAPDVANVAGDGLLTMEEILSLKLDADWVVLSACNTGAGAGAGAEAASGLGRAFFYAGTRALLVTNWSVHSQSARDLTTDLFRRQTADPNLSRSEALRQAMLALLDGKGFTDAAGTTVFSYAHPLFWAPYTIIGDGG